MKLLPIKFFRNKSYLKSCLSTFRPLPVLDTIQTLQDLETKEAIIVWEANPDSYQDEYKITYYELENDSNGVSSSVYVADTSFSLSSLQPGRNYSISISAVAGSSDESQEVESTKRTIYKVARKIGNFDCQLALNILSIILLVLNRCWKRHHQGQTIHPTENFISLILFKMRCICIVTRA